MWPTPLGVLTYEHGIMMVTSLSETPGTRITSHALAALKRVHGDQVPRLSGLGPRVQQLTLLLSVLQGGRMYDSCIL